MRLARATPEAVELRERRMAQPPLFVGLAFTAMGCATLLAEGTITGTRALAAAGCLALGLGLVATSWPRVQRVILEPKARRLVHAGESVALSPEAAFHLSAVEEEDEACEYRVELRAPDAEPVVVLSSEAPDEVLRDLEQLLCRIDLPVRSGWGLPDGAAPWAGGAPARRGAPEEPLDIRLRPFAGMRDTAWTVGVGAAIVGGIMTGQIVERLRQGDELTLFSATLPVVTVLCGAIVGLLIATHQVRLVRNGTLRREVRVLGFPWSRTALARDAVRGVYPVGLDATRVRHLLLDTDSGPMALPCGRGLAAELERRI